MQNDVEQTLSKFADAIDSGESIDLAKWTELYPKHAAEIVKLAQFKFETTLPDMVQEEAAQWDAAVLARADAVRQRMQAVAVQASLNSILIAAKGVGLSPLSLAELLQIGVLVLQRLDRRIIRPETIPSRLKNSLADAIRVSRNQLDLFLSMPPRLAANANYRAKITPTAANQQSFTEVIISSPDMSSDLKSYWLSTPQEAEA